MNNTPKIVFITGSSIGIGKETALLFAKQGANVIVTYFKDKKEGEKVVKECKRLGSQKTILLQLNVMEDESIKKTVAQIVKEFGHIDVLVNNAGVIHWKPLSEHSFKEIEEQIRTNLEGLIKVTLELLPYVKETIINIASGVGYTGYADLTVYGATKWGVRGFTKALASELPSVNVFTVNPGMTKTRMTNFSGTPPEKVAEIIVNTAKGLYGLRSGSDVDVWEYV